MSARIGWRAACVPANAGVNYAVTLVSLTLALAHPVGASLARVGKSFSRRLRPEELGQGGLELVCDRRERRCEIGADRGQRRNRGNRDESGN